MRDRSSSPQKHSTGSQQGSWYVALGKGRSGKTQKKLFCPGGKYTDPFPIVFKVPSEDLTDEILTYRDAIKIIEAASDVRERVRLIFTMPVGENILKQYIEESAGHGLYPVCWGSECAVFCNIDDARSAIKAVDKPIYRKVPCFRRAIAYMVSAGESEKEQNMEFRQLLTEFLAPKDISESTNEEDEPSIFPMPMTPRRPARVRATPTATPSRSPRKAHASPQRVAEQSDASEVAHTSTPLLSDLLFDLSITDNNIEGDFIYQHTRNLRGIKASHAFPVINNTKVPSCGRALDTFLQVFGFDVDSKLLIAFACKHSATMEDFVRQVMAAGVPVLEAKYMWTLYESDPPVGMWCETYIM